MLRSALKNCRYVLHSRRIGQESQTHLAVVSVVSVLALAAVSDSNSSVLMEADPKRKYKKNLGELMADKENSSVYLTKQEIGAIAGAINGVVDLLDFDEEEEQEIFQDAVAKIVAKLSDLLPPTHFRFTRCRDAYLGNVNRQSLIERLTVSLEHEIDIPYLEETEEDLVIAAVLLLLVEAMEQDKCLSDVLKTGSSSIEFVGLFVKGAMGLQNGDSLREKLSVLSDIPIPFMPNCVMEYVISQIQDNILHSVNLAVESTLRDVFLDSFGRKDIRGKSMTFEHNSNTQEKKTTITLQPRVDLTPPYAFDRDTFVPHLKKNIISAMASMDNKIYRCLMYSFPSIKSVLLEKTVTTYFDNCVNHDKLMNAITLLEKVESQKKSVVQEIRGAIKVNKAIFDSKLFNFSRKVENSFNPQQMVSLVLKEAVEASLSVTMQELEQRAEFKMQNFVQHLYNNIELSLTARLGVMAVEKVDEKLIREALQNFAIYEENLSSIFTEEKLRNNFSVPERRPLKQTRSIKKRVSANNI